MWLDRIKHISAVVEKIPSVKAQTNLPTGLINNVPRMSLTWDPAKVNITAADVVSAMKAGTPSIKASGNGNTLNLGVVLLLDDQVDIVAKRVREILEGAVIKVAKT
jgi:L-seryl-tRNA(Ser) seleniumtransferase